MLNTALVFAAAACWLRTFWPRFSITVGQIIKQVKEINQVRSEQLQHVTREAGTGSSVGASETLETGSILDLGPGAVLVLCFFFFVVLDFFV